MASTFIYLLKPRRIGMLTDGPTAVEGLILSDHFTYLTRMADNGSVVLAGRTTRNDETTFGIVLIRAADPEAATDLMKRDPAVAEGVMTAELVPFTMAIVGSDIRGTGGSVPSGVS